MRGRTITVGTRGSALAMAQALLVCEALDRAGCASATAVIETAGDRRAPNTAWGEGAFVTAIEQALLDGRVDVAVHSAKDIPTDEDPRLRIAAYLPRADARDALVVRAGTAGTVDDLPSGTRVGTDSPRRTAFLLFRRPDLVVHPLHGNVDTRLRKLDTGETDALVLACAGLDRLGRGDRVGERLPVDVVLPAPGQGAIAIQCRAADTDVVVDLAGIDDQPTRIAVEAEREFLRASGGGCRAPIGASATVDGAEIELLAGHASLDGTRTAVLRGRAPLDHGRELARELARELGFGRASAPRVLVTRPPGQADDLLAALRDAGLEPVHVPAIAVELGPPPRGDLDRAAARLADYRWVVLTSANGATAVAEAARRVSAQLIPGRFAAVGAATARVLDRAGASVAFTPSTSTAAALARELPVEPGDRILAVRGDLAAPELPKVLRDRGAAVDDVVGYRTIEAPQTSRHLLAGAFARAPIAAAVFTSGSTARGLAALARDEAIDITAIPAICIGTETAEEARKAGYEVLAVAASTDPIALARTAASVLRDRHQEMP